LGLGRAHEVAGLGVNGGLRIDVISKGALGLVTKISVFQIDKTFGTNKIGCHGAPKGFVVWGIGNSGTLRDDVFG